MKKPFLLLLLLVSLQTAFAQSALSLLVPTDVRSLTLGGIDSPRDVNKLNAQALYGIWAPKGARQTLVGGEILFRASSRIELSLQAQNFKAEPYTTTSAQGIPGESFQPNDLIAGLGISVKITDAFSVGMKGRMVSSTIAADAKGSAFCADLSLVYTRNRIWSSLSMKNFGSKLSYGGDSYALPTLAALQAGTQLIESLSICAEVDYLFSGALMAGLGTEYTIADFMSVRGGFHYGDPTKAIPMYASMGIGLRYAGAHLDFAFLFASKTLGNTIFIGLGYAF